jgi:Pyridoxal-phosphate dependent enzyme
MSCGASRVSRLQSAGSKTRINRKDEIRCDASFKTFSRPWEIRLLSRSGSWRLRASISTLRSKLSIPLGSVKDRLALGVIEDAERSGKLKPGQTVIEATSGNTGIGLAMVCAQKGYPLVVTMAETFSVERRKLMRFLGAKVILTPADERGIGMVNKAVELAQAHQLVGEFLLDRQGIIRWSFTEVTDGGKNLFGAPTPQDVMSAASRVAG